MQCPECQSTHIRKNRASAVVKRQSILVDCQGVDRSAWTVPLHAECF